MGLNNKSSLFRIFIAILVFGSFAVAGIFYKHSVVEKEVKKELSKHEDIKFQKVRCMGVQELICHIEKIEILEDGKTFVKIEDLSFEDVNDFENFAKDQNGTLPFKIFLKNITFTKEFGLSEKRLNTKSNLKIFGNLSIIGEDKFLNLDEFKIEDNSIAFVFGGEFKGKGEKDISLKSLNIALHKKDNFKDLKDDFEKELKPIVSKLKDMGTFSKKSGVEIDKFLINDEVQQIKFSVETKDQKYLNLMKLYMEYFMTISLGGDGDKLLEKSFKLNIESK